MKKSIFTILLLIVSSYSIIAQQISFEYGKVISKFDYTNSDGEALENIQGSTNNHIGVGWRMPIKQSDFYFISNVSYNKYSANGSDATVFNYYNWEANYLGVNLGAGYEFLKSKSFLNVRNVNTDQGFTIYLHLLASSEFFMQGTQTINNRVYKLNGVEQFDKPFVFGKVGLGLMYYASKTFSVYTEYTGGMSFPVFKSDSGDNEELNLITHVICFGVTINLPTVK